MKHHWSTLVGTLVATAGVSVFAIVGAGGSLSAAASKPAAATTTTTTIVAAPPIQNRHKKAIFAYFDTVTGGAYKPEGDCQMTNIFQQGQTVVFRMWGVDVKAGGTDLTDANVQSAVVTIPGLPKAALVYAKHPTGTAYWTYGWNTAAYPLGIVNFTITVTTKAVKATSTAPAVPSYTAVFSQAAYPPPSQLTVVTA